MRRSATPRHLDPTPLEENRLCPTPLRRRDRSTNVTGRVVRGSLGNSDPMVGASAQAIRFPAIGLTHALESARALWLRSKEAPVPPETAVRLVGFKHLSPRAQVRLAALRSYGLIEDDPAGIRLSPLALTIIRLRVHHREGSSEYLGAVRVAALQPRAFRELFASHGHASYDTLKAYLEAHFGFTAPTVRSFIAAFRDTIGIARLREGASDRSETPPAADLGVMPTPLPRSARDAPSGHTRVFNWPLGREVSAELHLIGAEITPAHLRRLRKFVELVSLALEPGFLNQATSSHRAGSGKIVRWPRRGASGLRPRRR